jgi:hypothetical protein
MTPPLIPDIKSPLDTSHFRNLTEQLSQGDEREMSLPVGGVLDLTVTADTTDWLERIDLFF